MADVRVMSWEEAAFADPGRFAGDLRVLGLGDGDSRASVEFAASAKARADAAVSEFRASQPLHVAEDERAQAEAERIYNSARGSALGGLRKWWKDRSIRIEDRIEVPLRLPLFLLSAAGIPGCTASFTVEGGHEREFSWSVTVLGSGLGADSNVRTSASATFKARSGERKVAFLPVMISVEKVAVVERGKAISHGHRIDVAGLHGQANDPAVMLLEESAVPPLGPREHRYQLSDDATGGIATYTFRYWRSRRLPVRLGVKAYGTEIGLSVTSEMDQSTTLTYELIGGHDYSVHRPAYWDGVLWA